MGDFTVSGLPAGTLLCVNQQRLKLAFHGLLSTRGGWLDWYFVLLEVVIHWMLCQWPSVAVIHWLMWTLTWEDVDFNLRTDYLFKNSMDW